MKWINLLLLGIFSISGFGQTADAPQFESGGINFLSGVYDGFFAHGDTYEALPELGEWRFIFFSDRSYELQKKEDGVFVKKMDGLVGLERVVSLTGYQVALFEQIQGIFDIHWITGKLETGPHHQGTELIQLDPIPSAGPDAQNWIFTLTYVEPAALKHGTEPRDHFAEIMGSWEGVALDEKTMKPIPGMGLHFKIRGDGTYALNGKMAEGNFVISAGRLSYYRLMMKEGQIHSIRFYPLPSEGEKMQMIEVNLKDADPDDPEGYLKNRGIFFQEIGREGMDDIMTMDAKKSIG